MALDVFYSADIERVLQALASAGEPRGPEYRRALRDVGLAFGIEFPTRDEPDWAVLEPVLALTQ